MSDVLKHLDFARISNRLWSFSHENKVASTNNFQFLSDGRVGGYDHNSEKYWEIKSGILYLLNSKKNATVKFDIVDLQADRLILKGKHIPNPKITLCLEEGMVERLRYGPTKKALSEKIEKYGWSVGDYTYGVPGFIQEARAHVCIGKYCSIASGVTISLGNHRTDTFTTYPFRTLRAEWKNVPPGIDDHSTKGGVSIGNDVWIGTGAFIGSGVSIGDGAVIGAKAVVVKDVPAYGIAVGNPARVARYRFDEDTIKRLLKIRWWDLPHDSVESLIPALMSQNSSSILDKFERIRLEIDLLHGNSNAKSI